MYSDLGQGQTKLRSVSTKFRLSCGGCFWDGDSVARDGECVCDGAGVIQYSKKAPSQDCRGFLAVLIHCETPSSPPVTMSFEVGRRHPLRNTAPPCGRSELRNRRQRRRWRNTTVPSGHGELRCGQHRRPQRNTVAALRLRRASRRETTPPRNTILLTLLPVGRGNNGPTKKDRRRM